MHLPVSYLSSYSKRQNSQGTKTLLGLFYSSSEKWKEREDAFYDGEES